MSKPTDDWFDDLYESDETTPSSVDDVVVHLAGRKSRRWAPPAALSAIAAAVFVVVLILPEASSPTSSDSAPADLTPVQRVQTQVRDSDTQVPTKPDPRPRARNTQLDDTITDVPADTLDQLLRNVQAREVLVETATTPEDLPRRVEAAEAPLEKVIVTGSDIKRAAADAPVPQTSAEAPPPTPSPAAAAPQLRMIRAAPEAADEPSPPAQIARLRAHADAGIADDEDDEGMEGVEEVLVTGSYIRRNNFELSCSSIAATGRIDDLDAVAYRCPPGVVVQWDGACDGSIATTDTVEEVDFNDGAIELRMGGAVHRYRCVDGQWESD